MKPEAVEALMMELRIGIEADMVHSSSFWVDLMFNLIGTDLLISQMDLNNLSEHSLRRVYALCDMEYVPGSDHAELEQLLRRAFAERLPSGSRTELMSVVRHLVSDIDNTGGVYVDSLLGVTQYHPAADENWTDLGHTYHLACKALGREVQMALMNSPDEEDVDGFRPAHAVDWDVGDMVSVKADAESDSWMGIMRGVVKKVDTDNHSFLLDAGDAGMFDISMDNYISVDVVDD